MGNKENIPKHETYSTETAENKRLSSYNAVRSVDAGDSPSVKETEAKIAAVKKATEIAEKVRQEVESSTSKSSKPTLDSLDEGGPVYYGLGSTARRESRILMEKFVIITSMMTL